MTLLEEIVFVKEAIKTTKVNEVNRPQRFVSFYCVFRWVQASNDIFFPGCLECEEKQFRIERVRAATKTVHLSG